MQYLFEQKKQKNSAKDMDADIEHMVSCGGKSAEIVIDSKTQVRDKPFWRVALQGSRFQVLPVEFGHVNG